MTDKSKALAALKEGDTVTRLLAGVVTMRLEITAVDDEFIHCGPWKFSRKTGVEIDDELDWDENKSGSYLDIKV